MTPNVPNTTQGSLPRFPHILAPLTASPQESTPATNDSMDKKRSRHAEESGHTRKKIAGELMVEYVAVPLLFRPVLLQLSVMQKTCECPVG